MLLLPPPPPTHLRLLRGKVQLRITDIVRLEADRNYTRFVLTNGQILLTAKNISFYEEILAESFVRVHKSHLLNRNYITAFGKLQIRMQDGSVVKVARRKRRMSKKTIN